MADLTGMLMAASGSGGGQPDPNFNQTVLLLHGDGTNGAQNNTFLDSSTNNFTITRNGNTTQGTFSPFSLAEGQWSNYFDGNGDYLEFTGSSATQFSTGDFTVACWIYLTSVPAFTTVLDLRGSLAATPSTLNVSSTAFNWYNGSSNDTTGITPAANTWYYLVVSRVSSTTKIFVNGTEYASFSDTTDYSTGTGTIYIGKAWDASNYYVNGYISNFRIIKGSGITTAPVPTSPFTAISGTSLLTCQSNRFIDNSSNAFAITVNGNPSVQPFSPFAPSAAYSASVNGGSGYFDGTGDYLSAPDNPAFDLGTSDFTIEGWVYLTATSGSQQTLCAKGTGADNQASYHIALNGSTWVYYLSGNGSTWSIASGVLMGAGQVNAWTHIALVRSGSTFTPYVNGVAGTTTTDANSLFNSNKIFSIGADDPGGQRLTGYISALQVLKGTAINFATTGIPTAPPTNITNTSLLCNFTNAGIFDNTGKNNLETVGNAQIDTGTKKYGTGSMEFDGTGDYLVTPGNNRFEIGSGDFTMELWVYSGTVDAVKALLFYGQSSVSSYANQSWALLQLSDGKIIFETSNGASAAVISITSSSALSQNTWTHIAMSREGSTYRLFFNGTSEASGTSAVSVYVPANSNLYIGHQPSLSRDLNGFIDDLRITKGVARYTSAFTPPTAAFPDL